MHALNVLSFLWPHREGRLDVISSWIYGSGGGRAWRNFFDSMHLEKTYVHIESASFAYLSSCLLQLDGRTYVFHRRDTRLQDIKSSSQILIIV